MNKLAAVERIGDCTTLDDILFDITEAKAQVNSIWSTTSLCLSTPYTQYFASLVHAVYWTL